jgi:hypothetical protein
VQAGSRPRSAVAAERCATLSRFPQRLSPGASLLLQSQGQARLESSREIPELNTQEGRNGKVRDISKTKAANKARAEANREKRKQETPAQVLVNSQEAEKPEEQSTYTLKAEEPTHEPLKDGLGTAVDTVGECFLPNRNAAKSPRATGSPLYERGLLGLPLWKRRDREDFANRIGRFPCPGAPKGVRRQYALS